MTPGRNSLERDVVVPSPPPAVPIGRAPSIIRPLRDAVVAALTIFAVAMIMVAALWRVAKDSLRDQVNRSLTNAAELASVVVDGDLHRTFIEPAQEQTEAYQRAIEALRRVLHAAPEVKYIYTMRLVDDQPRFVLDPTPPGKVGEVNEHSSIMDPYENPDPELLTALREGRTMVQSHPTTDQWGTFFSAYAPLYDSKHRQVGIVGVDITVERYMRQLASLRRAAYFGMIGSLLTCTFIGGCVYLLRNRAKGVEEQHRHIIESVTDGLIIVDRKGRIVEANPAACAMAGFPHEAMLGRTAPSMVREDHADTFERLIHRFSVGTQFHAESIGIRSDGSTFDFAASGTGFRFRGDDHLLIVLSDVTEAKQAEHRLRETLLRLETIIERTPMVAIQSLDRDGTVLTWNPAGETLYGYTAAEAVGKRLPDLILRGEAAERFTESIERVWTTGVALPPDEWSVLNRRGEVRWVYSSLFPVLSHGRVVEVYCMDIDITERKFDEEAIRANATALEEANKKLVELNVAAQAANRAKSEFLANMSHEIRTPMTAILGYLELIQDGCLRRCEFGGGELTSYMEVLSQNADLLLNIVNNILDLSKIEAGRFEVERIPCSPVEVAADVAGLLKVRATSKGLALDVECDGPLPETIQTDPIRLRQILINLVGNAIKFTEIGGVRVVLRFLAGGDERSSVRIDVIDTGVGIPANAVADLFQPFSQVDTSTTRRFGGTGLGLTISKRLALLLGGDITVAGEVGRGTTFSLVLPTGSLRGVRINAHPVLRRSTPEPLHAKPETAPNLTGANVLLAEDGPDNQRLISLVLKKAGAEVEVVDNGRAAVEAALKAQSCGRPFDVVLMDIQMPELDGCEATQELRNRGYRRPVVALTAHAMKDDRQRCLDAGCNDYLSKPVDRLLLLATVAGYRTHRPASPAEAAGDI